MVGSAALPAGLACSSTDKGPPQCVRATAVALASLTGRSVRMPVIRQSHSRLSDLEPVLVRPRSIGIARVSAGKIVEEWENFDDMGMMMQLGAVHMAIDSGAREGELLALRWSDVDLDTGLIPHRSQCPAAQGRTHVLGAEDQAWPPDRGAISTHDRRPQGPSPAPARTAAAGR